MKHKHVYYLLDIRFMLLFCVLISYFFSNIHYVLWVKVTLKSSPQTMENLDLIFLAITLCEPEPEPLAASSQCWCQSVHTDL